MSLSCEYQSSYGIPLSSTSSTSSTHCSGSSKMSPGFSSLERSSRLRSSEVSIWDMRFGQFRLASILQRYQHRISIDKTASRPELTLVEPSWNPRGTLVRPSFYEH